MLVLGLDGQVSQCLSREQLAHAKGAIEESLMKALLPEGCGGRTKHLRLALAGSRHYLGLKGLEEEAGFTEPRRAALGQAAKHAACTAPGEGQTSAHVELGAGMADGEKPRQCPNPLGGFLPLGCTGPNRLL